MHTRGDDAVAVDMAPADASAVDSEESRVEVYVTTDTSAAPQKADEPRLYVMHDAANPDGDRLYFTEAEWDAFVLGVKDGEVDLDESGNLPSPGQPARRRYVFTPLLLVPVPGWAIASEGTPRTAAMSARRFGAAVAAAPSTIVLVGFP